MAIGDVAKGFESAGDLSIASRQEAGPRLFTAPSETILKALERLEEFVLIRDAVTATPFNLANNVKARYAFARLVAVMGENILDKIPLLIGGLLRKSNTWELIDFLPFLGLLIHKFKVDILLLS
jgi:exportin-T